MRLRILLFLFAAAIGSLSGHLEGDHASPCCIIDAHQYLLGALGPREWTFFEGRKLHGRSLKITFNAHPQDHPATLFIRQKDVKLHWPVSINGKRIGKLDLLEGDVVSSHAIPAGTLVEGANALTIDSPGAPDDILIGEFKLDTRPPSEALHEASFHVEVVDTSTGKPTPCRLTIADRQGYLMPADITPSANLAVRSGVIYTGSGQIDLGLPAGEYTLYATRGPAYSLAAQSITVSQGQSTRIHLEIQKQWNLAGLASCDTHIHTLEFSGHGDATAEERAVTLAGEGIDIAITTEHNRYCTYQEAAERTHVAQHFTNIGGDEVTTPAGHFNVFPVANPQAAQPDFKSTDWPTVMASIRALVQPRIIILNHPRDNHSDFTPFAPANFNEVTGDNLRGPEFSFNAIEVVNSGAMQSDFMQSYRDWFALLNHGYKITAVGSSDCHDVSRFIVGQGRTYVDCQPAPSAQYSTDPVCRAFEEGHAYVSLGLLTTMTVDGHAKAGDLATHLPAQISVDIQVQQPTWAPADRVELYANGLKIREQALPISQDHSHTIHWTIPRPAHDTYLVAIASGPGVTAPYWRLAPPYQPTSRDLQLRVIGSTNPVWLDADGDGKYTSPRAYAKNLVAQCAGNASQLLTTLAGYDAAISAQAAGLCQVQGMDVRSQPFHQSLQLASESVRQGFAEFIKTLPAQNQ